MSKISLKVTWGGMRGTCVSLGESQIPPGEREPVLASRLLSRRSPVVGRRHTGAFSDLLRPPTDQKRPLILGWSAIKNRCPEAVAGGLRRHAETCNSVAGGHGSCSRLRPPD